ncbi:MAG: hypothetical protein LQ337_007487 [Flavoplaca oasis]|nr:MAG: hypothetical protein LQ337_007487 [Flavoplaca oasis]
MPANFLSLAREMRDQIYELALVLNEPMDLAWDASLGHDLAPGLLRTNKIIHSEASSIFYSRNHFKLFERFINPTVPLKPYSDPTVSFFSQIARNNAHQIQHISIAFPNCRGDDAACEEIRLSTESASILARIQTSCLNLRTLTAFIYHDHPLSQHFPECAMIDDPGIITEGLGPINDRFRAIASLREIIVQFDFHPHDFVKRGMESHGWKVAIVPLDEEDYYYKPSALWN